MPLSTRASPRKSTPAKNQRDIDDDSDVPLQDRKNPQKQSPRRSTPRKSRESLKSPPQSPHSKSIVRNLKFPGSHSGSESESDVPLSARATPKKSPRTKNSQKENTKRADSPDSDVPLIEMTPIKSPANKKKLARKQSSSDDEDLLALKERISPRKKRRVGKEMVRILSDLVNPNSYQFLVFRSYSRNMISKTWQSSPLRILQSPCTN